MEARNPARSRSYFHEVKYEAQIYWFVIIASLVLAARMALGPSETAPAPRIKTAHHLGSPQGGV